LCCNAGFLSWRLGTLSGRIWAATPHTQGAHPRHDRRRLVAAVITAVIVIVTLILALAWVVGLLVSVLALAALALDLILVLRLVVWMSEELAIPLASIRSRMVVSFKYAAAQTAHFLLSAPCFAQTRLCEM
jgi:hypothetical protein